MTESKSKKNQNLDNLVKALQEKFGEGAIMRLGEVKISPVEVISSGCFSLDLALGIGGFPRGRIIELFGVEGSGKSTIALQAVASAQAQGGQAAYIDAEHALDLEYAKRLGVDVKNLLISQPDSGEEALNILETLVRSGSIDIIIVDSVAALTPQAEIEEEVGTPHIGLQARLMSQALRKLTAITAKTKTVIVFINQIRMKIGVMFGNPETTPGGRALKFYSSVRIDVRPSAKIKQKDKIVGHRIKAKIVKNKLAPPFRVAEFDLIYGRGIPYLLDVINVAEKYGVIAKAGASYRFGQEKLGVGKEKVRQTLRENKKLLNQIKKQTILAYRQKEFKEI